MKFKRDPYLTNLQIKFYLNLFVNKVKLYILDTIFIWKFVGPYQFEIKGIIELKRGPSLIFK